MKVPTPRFNLRNYRDKDGRSMVLLVVRYDRGKIVVPTGEKVKIQYWDKRSGQAKQSVRYPESVDINKRLVELRQLAIQIFRQNPNLSVDEYRSSIELEMGVTDFSGQSVLDFARHYVRERKGRPDAKRGTWKVLRTCANHIEKFNADLQFTDLRYETRQQFVDYLYDKGISQNYAAKMLEVFRQFIHEAHRRQVILDISFLASGWSVRKTTPFRLALTKDELKKLYKADLPDRLDRVRDLFIIGCFSGLRYSDFTRIKPENIVEYEGRKLLSITAKKTETHVVIPLYNELQQTLEKHGWQSPPLLSAQKMNEYLKEAAKLAGLNQVHLVVKNESGVRTEEKKHTWQIITSHVARRTFATMFFEAGIPASELMWITGHSSESQFMDYINIRKKRNAVKLAEKIARLTKEDLL